MERRKIRGECCDMLIILGCIIAKCRDREFPSRPALIERMKEQTPPAHLGVNDFRDRKQHEKPYAILASRVSSTFG